MNFPKLYDELVTAIQHDTGVSDTLLHVHAGMAVLLIARIVTGRSLSTPTPFLITCAALVANEVMDRLHYGVWPVGDTVWDAVNTLFWPLLIMIALRIRRPATKAKD